MRRSYLTVLSLVAAFGLLVAACGGDDNGGFNPIDSVVGAVSDRVVEIAMREFVSDQFPELTSSDVQCLATAIVDRVGASQLVNASGQALDLENVDGELANDLEDSLRAALNECDIDPEALGQ